MKSKIVVWVVGLVLLGCIQQFALHTFWPEVQSDAVLQQMEDVALSSNGFTLADHAKNVLVPFMCVLWTVGLFFKEVCSFFKSESQTNLENGEVNE